MKKNFYVYLDGNCISYTVPSGRKIMVNRRYIVNEANIKEYQDAGVFLISEVNKVVKKPTARAKPQTEVNALDKGDLLPKETENIAKTDDGRPSGVITKGVLK